MKTQTVFATFAFALFFGGAASLTRAGDNPAELSMPDILSRAAKKYASLNSYQDEGSTTATLGKITAVNYTFNIKLARTNLYQVVWWQGDENFTPKGAVWSADDGDYLWMGKGFTPRKDSGMELALAGATGISGGAASSIPGTFFNLKWGNQLGLVNAGGKRMADEKIGDVDCYVLSHGSDGRTNILWIGKSDFLIHQIENDTSAALLKKTMEEQAKNNPQIRTMLDAAGTQMFQDSKSVETHRNIVLNPSLFPKDFDFQPPAPSK